MGTLRSEHIMYAFPVDFYEEDEGWTAESTAVGIASCGDSQNDALAALAEALSLHFDSLIEDGEMDEFLSERNLEPARTIDESPAIHCLYVSIPAQVQVGSSGTLASADSCHRSWDPQAAEASCHHESNDFVLA